MSDSAHVVSPRLYQALAIASGLEFYAKHRRPINRMWTPKNMLAAATRITGNDYRRSDYLVAARDLRTLARSFVQ